MNDLLEKIVALCKRRGFIYPTSEIYGGLANSYDYGPLGVELMHNIKDLWWQEFIQKREDMVGIDSQILLHPQTWVASGHVTSFTDPMIEDKVTHKRYRADHLIENWISQQKVKDFGDITVEKLKIEEMAAFIKQHKIASPDGNEITEPKKFNLLFETQLGVVEGNKSVVYLRGETAQGIFTNFHNVINSSRLKLPFGIGQIGKSFRNEITTGQFIFRTLEFEQAEIEYFFDPETDWKVIFEEWKLAMWAFVTTTLGIDEKKLRWRKHSDTERSHYSRETFDLEYEYPFGWKELWGIAYRTDYDLKQHAELSGKDLSFRDPQTGKTFIPHVIEPAVGLNRILLMVLLNSYYEDEKRLVLKLKPALAPKTVAVFPLVANKPLLTQKARQIYTDLQLANIKVAWDDRGNIGKRYLAQDEAGTSYCITVDYESLDNSTVTIRNRDTTKQDRVAADQLVAYIKEKLV